MLNSGWFRDRLLAEGVEFFAGVPDSVLKHFCSSLSESGAGATHIVAANEGGAIGLVVGHHLATGKIGCAYMQNSGLGNAVNPLLSLADREVYAIPVLLVIGWRGRPGTRDEPQHMKQGRITPDLLDCMEIPWFELGGDKEEADAALRNVFSSLRDSPGPCAILVRNKLFSPSGAPLAEREEPPAELRREEAIAYLLEMFPDAVFVGTTGMASRELFELRVERGEDPGRDFLNVGAMGHASQIALGIARAREKRRVICIDGDGSSIMHLGAYAAIACQGCRNMLHVALNNHVHDSVGGQPTANPNLNFAEAAKLCGYPLTLRATDKAQFVERVEECRHAGGAGPILLEVMVKKGARNDLGRPGNDMITYKNAFMQLLRL